MITGNEPANPIFNDDGFCSSVRADDGIVPVATGLTIRQQFAMVAMQGILANLSKTPIKDAIRIVSEQSIMFADALIVELNKPKR